MGWNTKYCYVFWGVTIGGVWIRYWILLTPCTHHSELQAIILLSLISPLYKSPQHPPSLFPAYYYNFNSRSLAMTSNSGDSSASRSHVITVQWISRNWSVAPIVLKVAPLHISRRKHSPSIVVEACLHRRYIATVTARTTWKTPFYCSVRVCCGHYLATAAVYKVTA
jgi:hypothetical protein